MSSFFRSKEEHSDFRGRVDHRISAWADFGHVLGNDIPQIDRISFQSDQNMLFSDRQHSLLSA